MWYAAVFLALLAACSSASPSQTDKPKLLRECPEEWIINRQPRIVEPGKEGKAEEYFILRGKRIEKSAFDLEWVKNNCRLQPTIVH